MGPVQSQTWSLHPVFYAALSGVNTNPQVQLLQPALGGPGSHKLPARLVLLDARHPARFMVANVSFNHELTRLLGEIAQDHTTGKWQSQK